MDNKYSNKSVFTSLIWKLLERIGSQGIQFVIQIFLARLLSPEEFGSLAIVLVLINLAQTFVDGGFSSALIQKKNADKLDFSTIFYVSMLMATIIYILILYASPYVAQFYGDEELVPILRVLSLILFPGALNSIQNAYVSRNMKFKLVFKTSIFSTIISGLIGIGAALLNFGIWALVLQQITYHIINSAGLWITVKWRPEFIFSFQRVKELFPYGSRVFLSNFIYKLYLDIRILLIGKVYSSSELAFYQRGEQIPRIIVNNIDGSIQSVILPTLAAYQDDRKRIKSMVRRTVSVSTFLIFPMMMGIIVVAEPLVIVLLTEKWLLAVPFLQVFCLMYAVWPLITINLQPIRALGRSDMLLRLELIKRIIGLLIIVISLPFGLYAITAGALLERLIEVFINAYPNKKLIDYSIREQFLDILPSFFQTIVMGGIIYFVGYLSLEPLVLLILQIFIGVLTYLLLSIIFKNKSYFYVLKIIAGFRKTKQKSM